MGYAVQFNGTSQHMKLELPAALELSTFTVEAWINLTSANAVICAAVPQGAAADGRGYALLLDADGYAEFRTGDTASGSWHRTKGAVDLRGGVHHIAAVYDGANKTLYVDGVAVASDAYTNTVQYADAGSGPSPAQFYIAGERNNSAGTDANIAFAAGVVDDVAVYGAALSSTQVAENYSAGVSGDGYSDLIASRSPVAYWKLDETSGTTAVDAGAGGNNGTYINWPTLAVAPLVQESALLPMTLAGSLIRPAATLPMTLYGADLLGMTLAGSLIRPVASLPMRLLADALLPMSLSGSLIRPAATLPMTLETVLPRMTLQCIGALQSAAATLPMRLITRVESTAAALGMTLRGYADADITATNQRWTVEVRIDNTPVDRLVGQIEIQCEETASGTCRFDLLPAAGEVDPDDYERKRVTIDYVALNTAGVEQWRSRRFTGVTLTATYDPDTGVMSVEGSHELQSWFEDIDPDIEQDAQRATIASMVGGTWSQHVFDETADNWRYAQDRLSTAQQCIYIDRAGYFQRVAWAAKATADVVLTDSARFGNTLRVERPDQRDLVTRVKIGFDFRFNRLRHREIRVVFNTPGFCSYLNQGWILPSKSMIQSASEQGGWTRITDILWTDLPPAGVYCTPLRGWQPGGSEAFCLGASWTMARRWAQRVNEDYTIEVTAPNLEAAIGARVVTEDYGVEATYDATDFENLTSFDDRPSGSSLMPALDDWTIDAVDAEYNGRTAFNTAKAVAIARAQTLIAERARGWRVSMECPWRPDIGLDSTVEVDTPYLECKGKVFAYRERLDLDTGETLIAPTLALSRHYNPAALPADPVLSAAALLPMSLTGEDAPI